MAKTIRTLLLRHFHFTGKRKIINSEMNKQDNFSPSAKTEQGGELE